MVEFTLPKRTDRTAIVGRTGSGKTTMATWLLSHEPLEKKPWVVIDYKHETLFRELRKRSPDSVTELKVTDKAPRKPGLYIMHPVPSVDDAEVEKFLWRVWHQGNVGVYIDEAHLIPNNPALKAMLVTGRSLRIPMIVISQRPVWVPREVFSEANHHVIFDLNRYDDRKLCGEFVTERGSAVERMPEYCSLWHNVDRNQRFSMLPPPPGRTNIDAILDRAPRRFRWM